MYLQLPLRQWGAGNVYLLARTYLQLPLRQWGASNVCLLMSSSWKINNAQNPIALRGMSIHSGTDSESVTIHYLMPSRLWPSLSKYVEVFGLAEIVAQDSRLGADGFQFCRESISSQQYVAVQLHSRNFLLVHLLCQSSLLLSPFNMPSWQFIPRRKLRGRLGLVQGTTKISRLWFDSNLIVSWQYI